ncbi:MAG: hypothetical protein V4474_03405 [Patescibacteria group bacterium]
MNTRNTVIGIIVVLVLIGIGYLFWSSAPQAPTGDQTATTTPSGSNAITIVPASQAGLPGVQTGSLAVPSNTSAVITGYVAPNGAVTSYWFDYGVSGSLSNRTAVKSAGAGFVTLATPAFINGLASNTTYSYRLSAQNSFGTVQGSTYTFTTTANPPPAGSAPAATTNAASNVGRTAAVLNGTVDPNNSQTTYWFEYGPTQSFGNTSAFGSAGAGTDPLAVSIPVDSLNAQTTYYYRLNVQNNYGMVSGATQSFTTGGPAATGLPTVNTRPATNVATSSVTLNGTVNPHNVASTYWFEYGTTPLLTDILGTVSATQTLTGEATTNVSVNVEGLSTNTKYYYRVAARNPQGTVAGDIVSFTTKR